MDIRTETRDLGGRAGSTDLVPETMAVLDEFHTLADAAARLAARGGALRDDWRRAPDVDDAGDRALVDELVAWVERANRLSGPSPASYLPTDVAPVVIGNPLPGYFVG